MASEFPTRVREVVRRIPKGRVLSYRDVAMLAGNALAARQVSKALKDGSRAPWWRVVAFDGTPRVGAQQAARLRQEGVAFRASGKVDLTRCRWLPARAAPASRTCGRRAARAPSPPTRARRSRGT